jgi:hypothetical protein
MKLNKGRLIVGSTIVSLLILLTGMAVTADAQGHRRRDWDGYPNLGGSSDLRQTALNAGYNEGSKEGKKDRDKRRYNDLQSFQAYRDATKDYSSKLGDRDTYQRYYRLAFESGYYTENPRPGYGQGDNRPNDNRPGNWDRNNRRGRNWDRYGTYGGNAELRQTALNAGYNEGIKEGRNDRKKGRHRNYNDFSSYQKATTDYSSKLGDRELYRRYYREGFENGYEDGFNGY